MASSQVSAAWILIIFSIATILSYHYAPLITEWSKTAGLWESTILYILINPIYLSVFIFLSSRYQVRGFLASLLTVVALDIQSLPHVVVDGTPTSTTSYLFIDSIIYRAFQPNLLILYVVIPIGLMIISYELITPGAFVKTVRRFTG